MIAVDTNVVVRLLARDDDDQTHRARRLFERSSIWIGKTVILETEWVMRRIYELPQDEFADAIEALDGLPNVQLEDRFDVLQAVEWVRDGFGFADALHLAGCEGRQFASFDRALARKALKAGLDFVTP